MPLFYSMIWHYNIRFYRSQHTNDENGALLEEMVNQLKELEGPSSTISPNKSPSRELSGTLKNLKKIEQVILGTSLCTSNPSKMSSNNEFWIEFQFIFVAVLDKVLCEDFESDGNA